MSYLSGHETLWKARNTRKAEAACPAPAQSRPQLSLCCPRGALFVELRRTVVPTVPQRWSEGTPAQANSGASFATVSKGETKACRNLVGRSAGSRLRDRSLDTETGAGGNRQALSCPLHHCQCLAIDAGSWMELPEAGTAGQGEKRACHPGLETSGVGRSKKKPQSLGHISFSSMKAAFCWYHRSGAHGPHGEKPRAFRWQGIGIRSRPSVVSVFLPRRSAWGSISSSIPTRISASRRWSNFLPICRGTFEATSLSSGTTTRFIREISSKPICNGILAFIDIFYQAMRRNLTRTNSFGPISREPLPTAFRRIRNTSCANFPDQPDGFSVRKNFYGHAFADQSCHGAKPNSIHYLLKDQ